MYNNMQQTKRHNRLQITTKMHHFMTEIQPLPQTPPQWEAASPYPHLLQRLSSPSPDAEPSHFSFLSDAYEARMQ